MIAAPTAVLFASRDALARLAVDFLVRADRAQTEADRHTCLTLATEFANESRTVQDQIDQSITATVSRHITHPDSIEDGAVFEGGPE